MEVVCAVIKRHIVQDGRNIVGYLIGITDSGWEFIGGKVDGQECHPDAIKRVVINQVGAEIEIMALQHPITHSFHQVKFRKAMALRMQIDQK
jgi:hypothetical protein